MILYAELSTSVEYNDIVIIRMLPAPRFVGKNDARPTILNFVPQILDVT